MNTGIAGGGTPLSIKRIPVGGFRAIGTRQICAVWSAFRGKVLPKFLDVRVYFALHEIAGRRTAAIRVSRRKSGKVRFPWFDRDAVVREAWQLVGIESVASIRASFLRLERASLVRLTPTEICFGEYSDDSTAPVNLSADEMLAQIHEDAEVRERAIAIPRRTLRFLAGNRRPALAATMLGQMIRCLWWHNGRCNGVGSCSNAFVADLFDVHERNVKRARAELRGMGWLTTVPAARMHVNAHGAKAAINLAWAGGSTVCPFLSSAHGISKSPPPTPVSVFKSPPPIDKHNLPSGSKNHNPASGGPVGVRKRTESEQEPDVRRVQLSDLRDAARLDSLFGQAVSRGLVRESAAEQLLFFAAAEHAKRVGRRNPCGLFAAVVRRGLWRFISQADEERALMALKRREPWEKTARANVTARGAPIRLGGRAGGDADFVSGLVRELARLRSFDGMGPTARNRPPRDELRVAAA